ncbi:MAG: hypothetical protein KBA31_18335 [Alphaproteobacteria bacterium]|nr:hypothetical protein [Alphaproteobacteria bacterium]
MLKLMFPAQIDNTYRGYWLALLFYVPIVLMKFLMGFNVAGFNPWMSNLHILKDVDAVPYDTFGAEAASLLILFFASWGLGLLILSALGLVVLLRYRAMIPLMFVALTVEQVGRVGLAKLYPIVRAVETHGVSTGTLVNWGLTAGLLIGLVLSLMERKKGPLG